MAGDAAAADRFSKKKTRWSSTWRAVTEMFVTYIRGVNVYVYIDILLYICIYTYTISQHFTFDFCDGAMWPMAVWSTGPQTHFPFFTSQEINRMMQWIHDTSPNVACSKMWHVHVGSPSQWTINHIESWTVLAEESTKFGHTFLLVHTKVCGVIFRYMKLLRVKQHETGYQFIDRHKLRRWKYGRTCCCLGLGEGILVLLERRGSSLGYGFWRWGLALPLGYNKTAWMDGYSVSCIQFQMRLTHWERLQFR